MEDTNQNSDWLALHLYFLWLYIRKLPKQKTKHFSVSIAQIRQPMKALNLAAWILIGWKTTNQCIVSHFDDLSFVGSVFGTHSSMALALTKGIT